MLFTRSHLLLALLVAIAPSSAQTAGTNFSTCGDACLVDILGGSVCETITNVTCLCTNTTVQNSLGACLKNCSAADLAEAKSLESSVCANATSSTMGSSSASQASVTKSSSSSSSSSSTSTSSSSGTNAASPVEQLPFISTMITIAGVVIGGAFAL